MPTEPAQTKPWYKSKTIIVSIVVQILAVLELCTEGSVVPESWMPSILLVMGMLQMGLRVVTTGPLGGAVKAPEESD